MQSPNSGFFHSRRDNFGNTGVRKWPQRNFDRVYCTQNSTFSYLIQNRFPTRISISHLRKLIMNLDNSSSVVCRYFVRSYIFVASTYSLERTENQKEFQTTFGTTGPYFQHRYFFHLLFLVTCNNHSVTYFV